MTVFKSFFQVAKRNLWPVIIYVGIMVLVSTMTVKAMSGGGQQLKVSTQDYQIAILNEDEGDEVSQALISFIAERALIKDIGQGERAIRDALFWNDVYYVLRIPKGFGAALLKDEPLSLTSYASPNDYVHMYIDSYANRFIATLRLYRAQIPGDSLQQSVARVAADLRGDVSILPAQAEARDSGLKGMYYYFRYVSYSLLAAISSGMGLVLAATLSKGLAHRNRVGSLSETGRNLQLSLAGLCYSSLIWLVLMLFGINMSGLSLAAMGQPSFLLMLLASYLYMLTCMGITLLVTAFSTKAAVITSVSNVVALGSSFLGGVFVPPELLGENVLRIGRLLPAYWYTQAIIQVGEAAVLKPDVLAGFWRHLLIISLMLAVLLLGALIVNKYKRQRGI